MNGTFVFIVTIVAIVMFARIVEAWLKQRKSAPEPGEEVEETLGKMEQLEERIRVLERIVTENRVDLKRQIDDL